MPDWTLARTANNHSYTSHDWINKIELIKLSATPRVHSLNKKVDKQSPWKESEWVSDTHLKVINSIPNEFLLIPFCAQNRNEWIDNGCLIHNNAINSAQCSVIHISFRYASLWSWQISRAPETTDIWIKRPNWQPWSAHRRSTGQARAHKWSSA